MSAKGFLLSVFFIIGNYSFAQLNFKLPNVNMLDLYSKKMVDVGNLPKNGKSKVVIVTSQSKKQMELIGLLAGLKERGQVPLDALYIITSDRKPAEKLPGAEKNLNDVDVAELEALSNLNIIIYKGGKEELLKYYKINYAPIIFFLDADNNIVYCYEKDDISANQVSEINNLINTNVITANGILYFDKNRFPTTRANAVYYRNKISKQDNLYQVEDFYINGKPQMKGTFTVVYPQIYNGIFKFYTENGTIETERTYVNNRLNGMSKSFYKSGKLFISDTYKNDTLNGEQIYYYETGERYSSGILYKNNQRQGPIKLYFANGNLKASINYNNDQLEGQCIGYGPDKTVLFNVYYKNGLVDADNSMDIYNKKGDKIISFFRDYAKNKNTIGLYREFKCIQADGTIMEVGEFKEDINAIYKTIFNVPSGEKDLFYSALKNPAKNNLLQRVVFNAKGKLVDIEIYKKDGSVVYSFAFDNDKLIRGKCFYENGKVYLNYDALSKNKMQIFGPKGNEVFSNVNDDLTVVQKANYMSQNLKDNLLLIWTDYSAEEIRQRENDLLNKSFYLPEFLINNFLQIDGNWYY